MFKACFSPWKVSEPHRGARVRTQCTSFPATPSVQSSLDRVLEETQDGERALVTVPLRTSHPISPERVAGTPSSW